MEEYTTIYNYFFLPKRWKVLFYCIRYHADRDKKKMLFVAFKEMKLEDVLQKVTSNINSNSEMKSSFVEENE